MPDVKTEDNMFNIVTLTTISYYLIKTFQTTFHISNKILK